MDESSLPFPRSFIFLLYFVLMFGVIILPPSSHLFYTRRRPLPPSLAIPPLAFLSFRRNERVGGWNAVAAAEHNFGCPRFFPSAPEALGKWRHSPPILIPSLACNALLSRLKRESERGLESCRWPFPPLPLGTWLKMLLGWILWSGCKISRL